MGTSFRFARAVFVVPFLAASLSLAQRATLVVSGLQRPLLVTAVPGDASRLFVVEQTGRIRVVKGTAVTGTFLDLSSKVSCCDERGLLGLAFHPRHLENGRFYVDYTDASGNTVVSELRASADPDVADPSTERVLLRQTQPFANHNGGNLVFSPLDGMLYLGLGDGGSAGDPQNNAQNEGTWLGKLLRIDVDRTSTGRAYAIPPDNPFATSASPRAELWAKGLRNPWRFAFDRLTYDLVLADVGQGTREEVDFQPAASRGGENYGWRLMEGTACFNPSSNCQGSLSLVPPVHDYLHSGGRCSITGGPLVRSAALPELDGRYLFGDYCTGEVLSLRLDGGVASDVTNLTTAVAPGGTRRLSQISSFGEDALGNAYVCDYADGELYRLDSLSATAARSVPIVVDSPGRFGSRFVTSLAVANTGTATATLTFRYTAAQSIGATGSGTATRTLGPGGQLLLPDVVGFLRQQGLPIPEGVANAGTLRLDATGVQPSGRLAVSARTTTASGPGRAGVGHGAPRPSVLFTDKALLYGLRETTAERSNVAFVNAGADTLRLRLSLLPGSGTGAAFVWPEEIALGPGQWRQLDSPLAAAALANGLALVERVSGSGPFDAYAVINDNVTNDGSLLAAVRPLRPREDIVVPVVVETPRFDSELVVANPGDDDLRVTFAYVDSLGGGGRVQASADLPARAQRILPSALDYLRGLGAPLGPRGGSYSGTLTLSFTRAGLPAAGLAAVRVLTPAPGGGAYGVFLPGLALSETAPDQVDVVGLTNDASSRSNVAIAHAGGSPESLTLRLDVFDASGRSAGTVTRTLAPGAWVQEDALLARFGVSEGRVRVTRTAGRGRFVAYGVVNDGASPESGTSDGSVILGE